MPESLDVAAIVKIWRDDGKNCNYTALNSEGNLCSLRRRKTVWKVLCKVLNCSVNDWGSLLSENSWISQDWFIYQQTFIPQTCYKIEMILANNRLRDSYIWDNEITDWYHVIDMQAFDKRYKEPPPRCTACKALNTSQSMKGHLVQASDKRWKFIEIVHETRIKHTTSDN